MNCKRLDFYPALLIITKASFIDSLTHIVLGATIGDAILGKKLGKRAMFLGALAQSIPDIDFISSFWNDTATNLLAHRGFTHSLLFGFLATLAFGLLAEHFHRVHRIGIKQWLIFFGLQIGIHLFIDLFNSYGMGLFEPFSHIRISFNALFVADPFFSLGPFIAFVALILLKPRISKRAFWHRFGILTSSVYLVYCTANKIKVVNDVRRIASVQHVPHDHIFTTPTPLNNWLWYVAAQTPTGYYIGYRSVFDRRMQIDFHYFPRNDSLLRPIADQEQLQHLIRFSQGFYTVEKWNDTLVFNDLRFGQMVGWYNPYQKFVFHFYLNKKDKDNRLVVQRGRFADWNWTTTRALYFRIMGE